MTKKVRVNVRSKITAKKVRREKRYGREKIIVPSTTMPDDIIMNGIKYPANEIANSFEGLDGTPAPLGHPTLDGKFCSAFATEAYIRNGIGAENENARQEGGRVHVDKVIDVEFASRSEGGRAVLAAIEAGDPVHTSTGLLCELENVAAGADHRYVARNIMFDHDAILLDEDGAATPEQGVGMMVNSDGQELEVVHSTIDDQLEQEIDWAVDSLARAMERKEEREENRPLFERLKSAITEALALSAGRETSADKGDAEMAENDQLDELSAKVNALEEGIGDKIKAAVETAVKPLVDAQKAEADEIANKAQAEREKIVNKLVEGGMFTDTDEAEGIPVSALNKMVEKLETPKQPEGKKAAALHSGQPHRNGKKRNFQLPAKEEA